MKKCFKKSLNVEKMFSTYSQVKKEFKNHRSQNLRGEINSGLGGRAQSLWQKTTGVSSAEEWQSPHLLSQNTSKNTR